jgi:3-dehydroquinate synthase
MRPARIFLIGLSGSGKSTVGRIVAEQLGWDFADTDDMVEAAAGRSIPELFRDEGEAAFRQRECMALAQISGLSNLVVSTGGGAPTTPEGRAAIGTGFVVWLSVTPAEAARRLAGDPDASDRPLLAGDAESRLAGLLDARRAIYERADATVEVDGKSARDVAAEVVRLWEGAEAPSQQSAPPAASNPSWERSVAAVVRTPTATYPIVVEDGVLARLGAICHDLELQGRAFIVTDTGVGPLLGDFIERALAASGFASSRFAIPAGEEHKTLATVATVYDWLIDGRVERSDFVLCLGGGVVTDLGGFAAATCLRGIDFVHVPTTLLAMVDAAVGGKTGVDHPKGKNLIGAFAQPRAVVIDPTVLRSLPERQLRAGWAEVIKHGLILDEVLVRDLEAGAGSPVSMMSPSLIGRSVAIKAGVVSEDEREAGKRTLLNYGHTIGHAIEAVTGYGAYLHGEAVAIGMRAAALISAELGLLSADDLERQQRLLQAYGLPENAPGLSVDAVLDATAVDKKVRAGRVRWVLLEGIGNAVIRDNIPADVVRRATEAVLS